MGTWGPKLYEDDITEDVRGHYQDELHWGKTGPEITKEMMEGFSDWIEDPDEAPLFWFALADTQWSLGRLEEHVKEKALWYLENDNGLERWEEDPAGYKVREKVLAALREKLLSPQPKEKKVYKYRLYHNDWQIGDVFSYQFTGDYAKENGYLNKYVYFVKVGEASWWPGHIIPEVYVYNAMSDKELSLDELREVDYLPQFYVPSVYIKKPSFRVLYGLALICTSSRVIPKKNLRLVGNIGMATRIENENQEGPYKVDWKRFEEYMIKNYLNWHP